MGPLKTAIATGETGISRSAVAAARRRRAPGGAAGGVSAPPATCRPGDELNQCITRSYFNDDVTDPLRIVEWLTVAADAARRHPLSLTADSTLRPKRPLHLKTDLRKVVNHPSADVSPSRSVFISYQRGTLCLCTLDSSAGLTPNREAHDHHHCRGSNSDTEHLMVYSIRASAKHKRWKTYCIIKIADVFLARDLRRTLTLDVIEARIASPSPFPLRHLFTTSALAPSRINLLVKIHAYEPAGNAMRHRRKLARTH
ncbi:hypothetical protein EVAR_94289_1 [Eumeta japonica]|uniref:Uncharacterized protein n=1 Tax=Eumeta variegata TaxID=151549 RepID=A0A4C1UF09_EUMVA|nr:hypothetical protein EVAR_94289_1 [Eumeta japonica]